MVYVHFYYIKNLKKEKIIKCSIVDNFIIEKNLLVKKFIQKIIYSPENIKISLFYTPNAEKLENIKHAAAQSAAGLAARSAALESGPKNSLNRNTLLQEQNSPKLFTITIPNLIHKSKKKNLH